MHCVKLDTLVTVPLDFIAVDQQLQREKEKQQYHIGNKVIFQIIKNNVPKKYFELYMVESYRFLFTDNSKGDEIGDRVILLKTILDNIKPSNVINVQYLKEKLASATLQKYENNVLSCTRDKEKLYKGIRRLKTGTYDNNLFLTQLFCAFKTTTH